MFKFRSDAAVSGLLIDCAHPSKVCFVTLFTHACPTIRTPSVLIASHGLPHPSGAATRSTLTYQQATSSASASHTAGCGPVVTTTPFAPHHIRCVDSMVLTCVASGAHCGKTSLPYNPKNLEPMAMHVAASTTSRYPFPVRIHACRLGTMRP